MSTATEQALERIELLLQEKQAEIDRLLKAEEERDDSAAWSWTRHQIYAADQSPTLPVPRLEIRYRSLDRDGYSVKALYCLVYRHFTARMGGIHCNGSKDCVVFVPIGETSIKGWNPGRHPRKDSGLWADQMYGPHRDGAHIRHDMEQLGLPGFIIATDGEVYQIDLAAERKRREEWDRAQVRP